MRVQRAPRAADQPQAAPADHVPERGRTASAPPPTVSRGYGATGASVGFSGTVALDLTALLARLDEREVVAEIVASLVTACRHQELLDDASALCLVRPADDALRGVQLDRAVSQSAYSICSVLAAPAATLSAVAPGALAVVDLTATRVQGVGDWGLGGLAVATIGPVTTVVASHQQASGGLSVGLRRTSCLGLTVHHPAHIPGAVRALEAVARFIEGPKQ